MTPLKVGRVAAAVFVFSVFGIAGTCYAQEIAPKALVDGVRAFESANEVAELAVIRSILGRRPLQCIGFEDGQCASIAEFPTWDPGGESGTGILSYKISESVTAVLTSRFVALSGFICTDPRVYEDEYLTDMDVNDEVRELYRELVDEDTADIEGMICNGIAKIDGEFRNIGLAVREGELREELDSVQFLSEPLPLRLVE